MGSSAGPAAFSATGATAGVDFSLAVCWETERTCIALDNAGKASVRDDVWSQYVGGVQAQAALQTGQDRQGTTHGAALPKPAMRHPTQLFTPMLEFWRANFDPRAFAFHCQCLYLAIVNVMWLLPDQREEITATMATVPTYPSAIRKSAVQTGKGPIGKK